MYLNNQNFETEIAKLLPNLKERKFLLAVSGGADSMVLANLFLNLNLGFQIAHINYKLRGKDSDLDEKVVQDFCIKNDVKFHLYKASKLDKKPQNSVQLWARNLRYFFFAKIKSAENLDCLVTAHHLNDELETFIINLSRASGLKGLSGMPRNENEILRPLLKFSKAEIYRFAEENKIQFREDKSNQKSDYLRNFIRNEIAPNLFKTNENFLENFSKTLIYLKDSQDFISEQIEIKHKILGKEINNKIVFDKEKLNQESDFVKFELLKSYGFKDSNEISKIFKAESGKRFFSADFILLIDVSSLIISENNLLETDIIQSYTLEKEGEVFDVSKFINKKNIFLKSAVWKFDAEKIIFPLKLRKAKAADFFFPTGMIGKKKISKYFKDEKLTIFERAESFVLIDAHEKILGIIPHRQDRRFGLDVNSNHKIIIKWTAEAPII